MRSCSPACINNNHASPAQITNHGSGKELAQSTPVSINGEQENQVGCNRRYQFKNLINKILNSDAQSCQM